MDKIDQAKRVLEEDLKHHPNSLQDPISDARTYRKIKDYLFLCVVTKIDAAVCKDWLYKLYKEQSEEERYKFNAIVDILANVLYDFHEYIQDHQK